MSHHSRVKLRNTYAQEKYILYIYTHAVDKYLSYLMNMSHTLTVGCSLNSQDLQLTSYIPKAKGTRNLSLNHLLIGTNHIYSTNTYKLCCGMIFPVHRMSGGAPYFQVGAHKPSRSSRWLSWLMGRYNLQPNFTNVISVGVLSSFLSPRVV